MSGNNKAKTKAPKKGSNFLCRIANPSPSKVCEYVHRIPKQIMSEKEFRKIMGEAWFDNEHQAPEQWGLYYLDGRNYYPRFYRDISLEEAKQYLSGWLKRFIVINPYTRFKTSNDNGLVLSIIDEMESNPNDKDLKTILKKIIGNEEPFIINDILVNTLNAFSEVLTITTKNKEKELYEVNLKPNYREIIKDKYKMTKKDYFDLFDGIVTDFDSNMPLQQIYYGAPGTGKSFRIENVINSIYPNKEERVQNVFRTTFHPDSDYSTFVGCYKPTKESIVRKCTIPELIAQLKTIRDSGVTYPCQKFSAIYWESLKDLDTKTIKQILSACGFTDSMPAEVMKGIAIGQDFASKNGRITYSFVPQVFTDAYIRAWKNILEKQPSKKVFLVIEEINRGNCAQIFGDLFQLLDRDEKTNFSQYPIRPDRDLERYIAESLADYSSSAPNSCRSIVTGKEMVLPNNLYIWATMNTSDQSLFPIDSAFKRRWEWKYIPIDYTKMNWLIEVGNEKYQWGSFLKKVNVEIEDATSSEDKKLGYFFTKANNGIISVNTFVSKVVFYIYNDVFKDQGFDREMFSNGKGGHLSFSSFFDSKGNAISSTVLQFLNNLKVLKEGETDESETMAEA